MIESSTRKTILLASSDLPGDGTLNLGVEVREIESALRSSSHRSLFRVVTLTATRPRDIRRAMLELSPHIVHFCGHGIHNAGLVMESNGDSMLVGGEPLAYMLELCSSRTECVLLNACYSEQQIDAIARHIEFVIGVKQDISDREAIEFAISFYDALGAGVSIPRAFDIGRNAMELLGVDSDRLPVLRHSGRARTQSSLAMTDSLQLQSNIDNNRRRSASLDHERVAAVRTGARQAHPLLVLLVAAVAAIGFCYMGAAQEVAGPPQETPERRLYADRDSTTTVARKLRQSIANIKSTMMTTERQLEELEEQVARVHRLAAFLEDANRSIEEIEEANRRARRKYEKLRATFGSIDDRLIDPPTK